MNNQLKRAAIIFLCAITLFSPSFAENNKALTLCKEIEKAWNLNETDSLAAKAKEFDGLDLSEKELSVIPDAGLEELSDALSHISIYLKNRLEITESLFREKEKRKILNKGDIPDAYYTYLKYRLFDKAKAIKDKFPQATLYSLPKKVSGDKKLDSAKWAVYDISGWDKGEVQLKTLDMDKGPRIIMFFFPGCHPGEKAMEDIMKDTETAKIFREHGVLLTFTFSPESVQLWKDHFKFNEIYIANKKENFPGFNGGISPNFYFLKDGETVSNSDGWSKINNNFIAQLNRIGIQMDKRSEGPETISSVEKAGTEQPKNAIQPPRIQEILKAMPEKELGDFLKSMKVNSGIIFYFDKALLARYYSGTDLDKICAFFTPAAKKMEKAEKKGRRTVKLGDVIKDISGEEGVKFLKHLNIYDGAIMSGSIGDLQKVLNQDEIEKIIGQVF